MNPNQYEKLVVEETNQNGVLFTMSPHPINVRMEIQDMAGRMVVPNQVIEKTQQTGIQSVAELETPAVFSIHVVEMKRDPKLEIVTGHYTMRFWAEGPKKITSEVTERKEFINAECAATCMAKMGIFSELSKDVKTGITENPSIDITSRTEIAQSDTTVSESARPTIVLPPLPADSEIELPIAGESAEERQKITETAEGRDELAKAEAEKSREAEEAQRLQKEQPAGKPEAFLQQQRLLEEKQRIADERDAAQAKLHLESKQMSESKKRLAALETTKKELEEKLANERRAKEELEAEIRNARSSASKTPPSRTASDITSVPVTHSGTPGDVHYHNNYNPNFNPQVTVPPAPASTPAPAASPTPATAVVVNGNRFPWWLIALFAIVFILLAILVWKQFHPSGLDLSSINDRFNTLTQMMDRKLPPPPVEDSVSLGRTNVVASKDTNRATFNVYAENMNIPGSNNRVNVAGTVDNSVHINIEQATDFFGPGWKVTRRYRIHPNTEIGKILEVAGPADTNEVVGIEVPDNLKVEVLDGYETTDVRIGDAAGSAEFNPAKNAYRPKEWTGTKQIRVRRKGNPTFEMKIPLLHLKIWPDKEKKPDDSPVEFQIPEGSQ